MAKRKAQPPKAKNQPTKKPTEKSAKNKGATAGKSGASVTTPKTAATPPSDKVDDEQNIIQRLINSLKRLIGYKKGERDEFRYNYDEKHPNYIFGEKDGKYTGFGLTHSETTFGTKNMPLEENPQKEDKQRSAYIRNGAITKNKKRYGGKMKNFQLSKNDKAKVKSKKRHHKKIAKQQTQEDKKSK